MHIIFFDLEQVKQMHEESIKMWGGLFGLRDKHLLESAINHPIFMYELGVSDDLLELAAAYCFHIIKNHAFLDGNKRTGLLTMLQFLRVNNKHVALDHKKLFDLIVCVASSAKSEKDIVVFLREAS